MDEDRLKLLLSRPSPPDDADVSLRALKLLLADESRLVPPPPPPEDMDASELSNPAAGM